ncbi:MAG: hypothetical protein IH991_20820 [Planctomycetes bacterium]|nr:hypothetical protein [Planctomycetota bacterium]
MPRTLLCVFCAFHTSFVLCIAADDTEIKLAESQIDAITTSTPRLDTETKSPYRSFQFECRLIFELPDGQIGRARYVVERCGNRRGLLVLSPKGVPVLFLNTSGAIGVSKARPGEIEFVPSAAFDFRCVPGQALDAELSFRIGGAPQLPRIELDIAGLIKAARSREHTLKWDARTRTIKLEETDGMTTSIRLRRRTDIGFPIESFSRFTANGRGVTITNFVVGPHNRDGNYGPRHLTSFREDPEGNQPRGVLKRREPTERWLREIVSLPRVALVDKDAKLIEAGERLERWIQRAADLEKRPIPVALSQESIQLPVGLFPQDRWFKRLANELANDATVLQATRASRVPFRLELVAYPRGMAAAYVEAWLGFKRTWRLYDFLTSVISDPDQPSYNQVRAIALLGRIGVPPNLVDFTNVERSLEAAEPYVQACWSACRLLHGAPTDQHLARTRAALKRPDWPRMLESMSIHGLANCGESFDLQDWTERLLSLAKKLGDGNLWGTDRVTALATTEQGRNELLKQIQRGELTENYAQSALLALEAYSQGDTRRALLKTARQLALDEKRGPASRSLAANVVATETVDPEFVQKFVATIQHAPHDELFKALPAFARGGLNVLLDDENGLPRLLQRNEPRIRRIAAATISELPTGMRMRQRDIDMILPVIMDMLDDQDEVVVMFGIQALRRTHFGEPFSRPVIDRLVKKVRVVEHIVPFCAIVDLLLKASDEQLVRNATEAAGFIPPPSGKGLEWWRSNRDLIATHVEKWWQDKREHFEDE